MKSDSARMPRAISRRLWPTTRCASGASAAPTAWKARRCTYSVSVNAILNRCTTAPTIEKSSAQIGTQ